MAPSMPRFQIHSDTPMMKVYFAICQTKFTQAMTERQSMPKIWSENHKMATRARTEAMSGCVMTRVTSGEKWENKAR